MEECGDWCGWLVSSVEVVVETHVSSLMSDVNSVYYNFYIYDEIHTRTYVRFKTHTQQQTTREK